MKYSYGFEETEFHGEFDSVQEAIAESMNDSIDRFGYIVDEVYIGESVPPSEFMTVARIGEASFEWMKDALSDEVGEAADNFQWNRTQRDKLGQLILDYVNLIGGFHCYGIKNVRKYQARPNIVPVEIKNEDLKKSNCC
jgi:hypothetical protein